MSPHARGAEGESTNIFVSRAGAIGDQHVPLLRITANQEIPQDVSLDQARAIYEREAKQLAEALFHHLPGGVVDRLIAELLLIRACMFLVKLPSDTDDLISASKAALSFMASIDWLDHGAETDASDVRHALGQALSKMEGRQ